MTRIVVTGSECTGKTTLSRALAGSFGAVWVPEYARTFADAHGAPAGLADVEAIARGQIALEREAERGEPPLVIQDTDLLSTLVYSRHYFGGYPAWIERALEGRPIDLYLLAGLDVPWLGDGVRDRGDRREEMQALFAGTLAERGLRFLEVLGGPEGRLRFALEAIQSLRAPGGQGRRSRRPP